MQHELTRLTDAFLCEVYKEYLERLKDGESLCQAITFQNNFEVKCNAAATNPEDDVNQALLELKSAGFVTMNIIGDFKLTPDAVSFMEHRFQNNLTKLIDFLKTFTH